MGPYPCGRCNKATNGPGNFCPECTNDAAAERRADANSSAVAEALNTIAAAIDNHADTLITIHNSGGANV